MRHILKPGQGEAISWKTTGVAVILKRLTTGDVQAIFDPWTEMKQGVLPAIHAEAWINHQELETFTYCSSEEVSHEATDVLDYAYGCVGKVTAHKKGGLEALALTTYHTDYLMKRGNLEY